jgi:uncharacterized OsmC-like protein
MASTAACAICKAVRILAMMRFNKCKVTGEYEYQCSDCRARIKSGDLVH